MRSNLHQIAVCEHYLQNIMIFLLITRVEFSVLCIRCLRQKK